MEKSYLTERQAISLVFLYLCGSSSLFGLAAEAESDLWIAIIIAIFMGLVISLIYARILSLYPNKNVFEIIENAFGKVGGKLIIALYTFYAFFLATLIVNDYGNFTSIIGLESTPEIVVIIIFVVLTAWGTRLGIKVLGRWSELLIIFFVISTSVVIILDIPTLEINNLKPILANGFKPVLKSAYETFSFPFAESVLFIFIFDRLNKKTSKYKVYVLGILFAGIFILATDVMSLLVLGKYAYSAEYFTLYSAASRISIGTVIQRAEILIALTFLLGGFAETAVCLLVTCKGMSRIFNCKSYKFLVIPTGILLIISASSAFDNMIEVSNFTELITKAYSPFFQIILPVILWLTCEFKNRKKEKKNQKITLQNE